MSAVYRRYSTTSIVQSYDTVEDMSKLTGKAQPPRVKKFSTMQYDGSLGSSM